MKNSNKRFLFLFYNRRSNPRHKQAKWPPSDLTPWTLTLINFHVNYKWIFLLLQISICVRWVYVEKGTTCYVKAYNGNPRNASDPLTPDDKEEFAGK